MARKSLTHFFSVMFQGGEMCMDAIVDGSVHCADLVRDFKWFYHDFLAAEFNTTYDPPRLVLYPIPVLNAEYVAHVRQLFYAWREFWWEKNRTFVHTYQPYVLHGTILLARFFWVEKYAGNGVWKVEKSVEFLELSEPLAFSDYAVYTLDDFFASNAYALHPHTKPHIFVPLFGSIVFFERRTKLRMRGEEYVIYPSRNFFKPWGSREPYRPITLGELRELAEIALERNGERWKYRKVVEFIADAPDWDSLLTLFSLLSLDAEGEGEGDE